MNWKKSLHWKSSCIFCYVHSVCVCVLVWLRIQNCKYSFKLEYEMTRQSQWNSTLTVSNCYMTVRPIQCPMHRTVIVQANQILLRCSRWTETLFIMLAVADAAWCIIHRSSIIAIDFLPFDVCKCAYNGSWPIHNEYTHCTQYACQIPLTLQWLLFRANRQKFYCATSMNCPQYGRFAVCCSCSAFRQSVHTNI